MPLSRNLLASLILPILGGCAAQIGDRCSSSVECGAGNVCDTAVTEGYCTRYDCEPGGCPDHSVCVDFGQVTACMRYCESDGDCRERDDHVCREDMPPTAFCYAPADPWVRPDSSGSGAAREPEGSGDGEGSGG